MPGIRTVTSDDFAKGFGIHSFNNAKEDKMTTGARIRQATKEASNERENAKDPENIMKATRTLNNNAGFEDISITATSSSTTPPIRKGRPSAAISQSKPPLARKNRSMDPKKNDNIRAKHSSKGEASDARIPARITCAKAKGMASPVSGLKRSLKKFEGVATV